MRTATKQEIVIAVGCMVVLLLAVALFIGFEARANGDIVTGAARSPFDSDGDGDIDLRDFAAFQNTYDLDHFAAFQVGFTGPHAGKG
jgi:hypothetical protein